MYIFEINLFFIKDNMRNKLLLICIVLVSLVKAQDPHFSQIHMQSMYLNPALTGSLMGWQTNLQYRNQWPSISAFQTYNFGVQKQITKYKTGLGLTVMNDFAGDGVINTTYAGLNYSRKFKLSESTKLSIGAKVELINKAIDWGVLTFGDMIDSRFGFVGSSDSPEVASSIKSPNFTMGADLKVLKGNFGLLVANIFEPNQAFFEVKSNLPRRYGVYGSYKFDIIEHLALSPMFNGNVQSSFETFVLGLNTQYRFLNCFLGYRTQDALIYGLGFNLNRLKIQYSYDQTISDLSNANFSSHEFGIIFRFGSKDGYEDDQFLF